MVSRESSTGKAVRSDGKIAYIEKHSLQKINQKILKLETSYHKENGMMFGNLNSDFTLFPTIPVYEFKDLRFDTKEGLKKEGEGYVAYSSKSPDKTKFLKPENNLVAGQGLYNYLYNLTVEENYDFKPIKIKFFAPANQETYDFQVSVLKSDEKTVTYKVGFQNWFMKMLAPHIEVTYDKKSKQLLLYNGPSNLLDDNKKTQNVKIFYEYNSESRIPSQSSELLERDRGR
jgi:hypothetical protein